MPRYLGILIPNTQVHSRKFNDGNATPIKYDGESITDCHQVMSNHIGNAQYTGMIFEFYGTLAREITPLTFTKAE